MDGGDLDATRHLAQYLGIPAVVLRTARPHTERADQAGGDHARVVACSARDIGHSEGLGTGFEDHAARGTVLEEAVQLRGGTAPLLENDARRVSDANL